MRWYDVMVLVATLSVANRAAAQETAYFGAEGARWSASDSYSSVDGYGVAFRAGMRGERGLIQLSGSWFPSQDDQRWLGAALEGGPRLSRGPVSLDAVVGLGILHVRNSPRPAAPVCIDFCLMDVGFGPYMLGGLSGGGTAGVQAGVRLLPGWEATVGLRASTMLLGANDGRSVTGWSFGVTRLSR